MANTIFPLNTQMLADEYILILRVSAKSAGNKEPM